RAGVEHRLYRAILLPHYQHVVPAHHHLEEIARLGNLRLVTKEQPRAREDPLHLEFEDRGVAVNAAVQFASLERDQVIYFSSREIHLGLLPRMIGVMFLIQRTAASENSIRPASYR